ncbi:MAG: hypothetical protein AB8H80_01915 [Planctomycetota bacterium]
MLRYLTSFAALTALAIAQDQPAAPAATPEQPVLPAVGSDEAARLVDQAITKLEAYGRGEWKTKTSSDSAMMRNSGLPLGATDKDCVGGWHGDLVWGEFDGREYLAANGRMLAKVDGAWRMRRGKLSGGVDLPFAFEPAQLLNALREMPKATKKVVNVHAGKVGGTPVVYLSWRFDADDAVEFADMGAVPKASGSGFTGVIMARFGALGGGAIDPPRPDIETYVSFAVDPSNGDLLRFGVKSYQVDQMGGNVAVQIARAGVGGGDDEDEEEEEEDDQGPIKWRRGFPKTKPRKDQSVMTFRVDFKKLGMVEQPELDAKAKSWLRVR